MEAAPDGGEHAAVEREREVLILPYQGRNNFKRFFFQFLFLEVKPPCVIDHPKMISPFTLHIFIASLIFKFMRKNRTKRALFRTRTIKGIKARKSQ